MGVAASYVTFRKKCRKKFILENSKKTTEIIEKFARFEQRYFEPQSLYFFLFLNKQSSACFKLISVLILKAIFFFFFGFSIELFFQNAQQQNFHSSPVILNIVSSEAFNKKILQQGNETSKSPYFTDSGPIDCEESRSQIIIYLCFKSALIKSHNNIFVKFSISFL